MSEEQKQKSTLDLAKDAQAELHEAISSKRSELIELLKQYESIGGTEEEGEEGDKSILPAVIKVIQRVGNGVQYRHLQYVFPDMLLAKARKQMKIQGQINETGKKGDVVLRLAASK